MYKQDWEILDPKLNGIINNLTNNIKDLKIENEKLNENIQELKDEIKNTNNIIIEQTFLFNQIKTFLEENRKKYMNSFKELDKKINKNKELNENITNEIKNKLNEKINNNNNNLKYIRII